MAGKRQSTDIEVGKCACGAPITIGGRYSVSTERPQAIKRVCSGYQCGRVNEIVLTVRTEVKRVNWEIHTCRCGSPIYTRSEYAGPGFEGFEGREPYTRRDEHYQNRTIKTPCRGCACKYVIQIRFRKDDGRRVRDTNAKVYRCVPCKGRPDREARNADA